MEANRIWFDNGRIYLETKDGKQGSLLLKAFPRLANATYNQLLKHTISKTGVHWSDLDEDLSFEGFFETKE